ncbi:peptidyl-tRNA hydrolase II [Athelia psychrophila]|uniref:peptidyl-tRNA hydrolase n=1 Tax=Athelia psychrophila TaxID=1759441 RepID=A0A166RPH7_9AGAM|nr:peptidyl-tRNA hydrolase II [Fibularhizoctonia sp. CBS 109695]
MDKNEPKTGLAEISNGLPPLVMQIIVRRDLLNEEGWGYGPLMAQTAHAATAVLHETRDRDETIQYLADLRNMHKAVLETTDVTSLLRLSSLLASEASPGFPVPHHLWIEQPENVPTCIAIAPNRKGNKIIRKALDKCKCRLWKD